MLVLIWINNQNKLNISLDIYENWCVDGNKKWYMYVHLHNNIQKGHIYCDNIFLIITIYNTVILVISVITFLDRKFLFIELFLSRALGRDKNGEHWILKKWKGVIKS